MSSPEHQSVLLDELISSFEGQQLTIVVDGTLGAGGHALALLEAHPEIQCYIGIDQDPVARELAAERLKAHSQRVKILTGNARDVTKLLQGIGVQKIDAFLMDLGVSSMQLDRAEKGFSFRQEGPLDMRMDPTASLTAADIVNTWDERDIARVLRDYGEEARWRRAARAIVEGRQERSYKTTLDLVEVLTPVLGSPRKGKIHPMTLVFQGLRIAVNDELRVLEDVLPQVVSLLRLGGRLAMISFHSLEDRLIKRFFQQAASDKVDTSGICGVFIDKQPELKLVTRKPLVATDEETALNPRSRSAKLRVAERC